MDIPKIDEIRPGAEIVPADERKPVAASEVQKRKCIYNKDMTCQVPDCKMEICGDCPYGRNYSFSSTVKDVFGKIISMSIFLAKSDDVLRDVIALISKSDAGKKGVGEGEEGSGMRGKTEDNPIQAIKSEEPKIDDEIVTQRPGIKPVNIKDVKLNPVMSKGPSLQSQMSKIISRKVADISEALANPNGPEKPLV